MKKTITALLFCLASSILQADTSAIQTGATLPSLSINDKGELMLSGDDISYKPWSSNELANGQKVQILQYLAARSSASKINEPFTDRLEQEKLSTDTHHVTTIINASDAIWGTGGFVSGELKSNKKKYPRSSLVDDAEGKGAKTWKLEAESSAIAILSPTGKVLFFKQGALSPAEIDSTVTLVKKQMKSLSAAVSAPSAPSGFGVSSN